MSGIRLRHHTLKNCVYTVEHPLRQLRIPHDCPQCGQHKVKTYHLRLDSEGATIVSFTVLERLKEIPFVIGTELTIENEVKKPPSITIGINGKVEKFKVVPFDKEGLKL